MASKPQKTVSFWQLVDVRDGEAFRDEPWPEHLASLHGARHAAVVSGVEVAGKVRSFTVPSELEQYVADGVQQGAHPEAHRLGMYGVSVWTERDTLPVQANRRTGDQAEMRTNSEEWAAVDNLFVWFLPFGNMFAVMRENNSAPREGAFVSWLTQVLRREGIMADTQMQLDVAPVIDEERRRKLREATGARQVTLGSVIGLQDGGMGWMETLFARGPRRNFQSLNVELVVKKTQDSTPEDMANLLDWFEETFGSLEADQGGATKASAKVNLEGQRRSEEVNLLRHRLTQKVRVELGTEQSQSLKAERAMDRLVWAYSRNYTDLLKAAELD
ncbi:hypothetical protein [Kocuria oceani]|uniref:Uncharacterized protein n=1 Tax=Kocuria oceani TaxID=988827 RepID=A0ABV9TJW7_9MICC|nr:hypothetical protein [Kocuria oceani]